VVVFREKQRTLTQPLHLVWVPHIGRVWVAGYSLVSVV
jgi:hypothetical protein